MGSRVSNPISTGGGGTAFEQQVGAMCLSCLLVHECYPDFENFRVETICLQTSVDGYETDDILVIGSTEIGEQCRMPIQVKLNLTIGERSPQCVKTFQKFWKDFNALDRFNPANDKLLLVTTSRTNPMNALHHLLELSRNSSGFQEFQNKLNTHGVVNSNVRRCHKVIRSIVNKIDSPNDKMLWGFLRTIHVHFIDFSIKTPPEPILHLLTKHVLEHEDEMTAISTWRELVCIAAEGAPNARKMNRSDLPEEMLEKYGAYQNPVVRILDEHSMYVISSIRSDIAGKITLKRRKTLNGVLKKLEEYRVVAITGPHGVGKSALAKSVMEHYGTDCMRLSFRAEEFGKAHIDEALPKQILSGQFKNVICAQQKVIIHLESLERLFGHPTHDAFADLVEIVRSCPNVSLLLTGIGDSVDEVAKTFFSDGALACGMVPVPPLNGEEMEQIAEALPALKVFLRNSKLKQLLSNPQFTDMAAKLDGTGRQDMPKDAIAFREKYWNDVVRNNVTTRGLPDRREAALIGIALKRARELRPFVGTDEIDPEALGALHNGGIVLRDKRGLAAPAHDIIEDYAILRWVDTRAAIHEWEAAPMADIIGQHHAVLRVFREWLKEKLDDNDENAKTLALSVYRNDSLSPDFRKAALASVLLSNYAGDFALQQSESLLADNARLLILMIRLTRTTCTKIPGGFDTGFLPIPFLLPDGKAWPIVLGIVADNVDTLLPAHSESILELVEDWSFGASENCPMPDGALSAGIIVDRLLKQAGGRGYKDIQRRALNVLARVPRCNERRFLGLIDPSDGSSEDRALLRKLTELLIYGSNGAHACREFPEAMSRFTLSRCCLSEEDRGVFSRSGTATFEETKFGLVPHPAFDRMPSAVRGPFLYLLLNTPKIGLRLILELVNHAGRCFARHKDDGPLRESIQSIAIPVSGHGKVAQWANRRLWLAYRGTTVFPAILQCALMALEYWLLRLCADSLDVNPILHEILCKSNNVMTTAVVASVCNAWPDLCGKMAIPMLQSRKCIELDRARVAEELAANSLLAFRAPAAKTALYDNERRKSNELPHRRHDLCTLSLILQARGYEEQVQAIIDAHLDELPEDASKTGSDKGWELTLYQMDLRNTYFAKNMSDQDGISSERKSGAPVTLSYNTEMMRTGLRDYVAAADQERKRFEDALMLWSWATMRQPRKPGHGDRKEWKTILALAKQAQQDNRRSSATGIPPGEPEMVAAVCIKDHLDDLTEDDRTWCVETLVSEVKRNNDSELTGVIDSTNHLSPSVLAANVLPKVLAAYPNNERNLEAVALTITHASYNVSFNAALGIAAHLGTKHGDLTLRCAGAVAMNANLLTEYKQQDNERSQEFAAMNGVQRLNSQARNAFIKCKIDPELEVNKLDVTSVPGRRASEIVLQMLMGSTDLELTKKLCIRVGQAMVDVWKAQISSHTTLERQDFNDADTAVVASMALTLSSDKIPVFCQPLLDTVSTCPQEIAFFINQLIAQQNILATDSSFWNVWQVFADRILASSWSSHVTDQYSTGSKLIESMLFNNYSLGRIQNHPSGHKGQVNKFVSRLPATTFVLQCFSRYLYNIGGGSLPSAFMIVANILRSGNAVELCTPNSVFWLELILQRHIYGQQRSLKADPMLRRAVVTILDGLVDAGSSSANKMRDDFGMRRLG